jgi:penicillin-binding protein 2
MTISQGGTGSGGSGPAVRKIYEAMYGVQKDGSIDNKKALLPHPTTTLPKINGDGTVKAPKAQNAQKASYDMPFLPSGSGGTVELAALTPDRSEKYLFGRRYWS